LFVRTPSRVSARIAEFAKLPGLGRIQTASGALFVVHPGRCFARSNWWVGHTLG
jgi:hypothetical protein